MKKKLFPVDLSASYAVYLSQVGIKDNRKEASPDITSAKTDDTCDCIFSPQICDTAIPVIGTIKDKEF